VLALVRVPGLVLALELELEQVLAWGRN